MPSSLRIRFRLFIKNQGTNRVYWLLLTLVVIWLVAFVAKQFDGQDMHTLAGRFVTTTLSPVDLLANWWLNDPTRWYLALLDVLIDTFFFMPSYLITLSVWCLYFSKHSLFVTNPYQPAIRRLMVGFGKIVLVALLVGAAADLVENSLMTGWLLAGVVKAQGKWPTGLIWLKTLLTGLTWLLNKLPGELMGAIRFVKLVPIAAAAFFILLHPLGIVFSLSEAFFRLFGIEGHTQENHRVRLVDHIVDRRKKEKAIQQELTKKATPASPSPAPVRVLRFREYLNTVWKGFLNVQYMVYLLLFMAGVFQLDQFDELFFSLLTTSDPGWLLLPERGMAILICTLLTLGLWGGMVYVCSKILLFIQPNYFNEIDPSKPVDAASILNEHQPELRLLHNVPVILAHIPFLIMAMTLLLDFGRLQADEQGDMGIVLKYTLTLLILAGAYWLFTRLIRYFHKSLDVHDIVLFKSTSPDRDYALLVDLAPRSILFGQGLLVLTVLVFLPTTPGLMLAQYIGLYAVVLLWLSALAYLGTILYQFNRLPDYPVLVVIILAVLLFSRYNDNSDIRLSPLFATKNNALMADSSLALQRPTVAAYYTRWLQNRLGAVGQPDSIPLPVVVIATAGGGIRAAAWTTEALYALNQAMPNFDRYVFGISGVSGGGVGAASYAATLAGHPDTLRGAKYAFLYDSTNLLTPLRNIVTEDLISPTAASMLFRGGVHNFLPVPVTDLDRNHWLEDAWESQVLTKKNMANDSLRGLLSESFLSLWPSKTTLKSDSLRLPALLLNGAVAETGQKIIMSNLNLGNTTDRGNPFYDVADLFASIRRDVPYKTATFLCARFPFVTSGGKASGPLPNITTTCQNTDYHIIDGGYAENTGILTAVQLIKNLQRIDADIRCHHPAWRGRRPVQYYLLFLPNYDASDTKGSVETFRFLAEPLKGLLNTWNRNSVDLNQFIGHTLRQDSIKLGFDYTSLPLVTQNHHYPLGWYISRTAVAGMGRQASRSLADSLHPKIPRPATVFGQLERQIWRAEN